MQTACLGQEGITNYITTIGIVLKVEFQWSLTINELTADLNHTVVLVSYCVQVLTFTAIDGDLGTNAQLMYIGRNSVPAIHFSVNCKIHALFKLTEFSVESDICS